MKAYVIGQKLDAQNWSMEVQYGPEPIPELRYATRELAVTDCMHLNRQRLKIGAHCCAFTVEELPAGDFCIICICHPVSQRLATGFA
jgi:hypothetical protein